MAPLLSQLSMARLLWVIAVSTISFNILYLFGHVPPVANHEDQYFFSDKWHVQKATVLAEAGDEKSVRDWMKEEANIDVTPEMEASLPTWAQIREVVGSGPVILGLESCPRFREIVPPLERMMGAAGIFNTGTNLVTHLLKKNCEIPERREKHGPKQPKESYGMRWQVPWGKHTPVKFRSIRITEFAKKMGIRNEYILPVVTIRNPYSWFGSMCKNGYTAKWDHTITRKKGDGIHRHCPDLKQGSRPNDPWNPVTATYADKREDHHLSLAHMWNDWYSYYLDISKRGGDDFPYLVIRIEDLVFYPKETLRQVCECAGGKIRDDQPFELITDSAKKDSKGHDASTGIYEAFVKYSKPNTKEQYGFSDPDYTNARKALNGTLMESLGYKHPS